MKNICLFILSVCLPVCLCNSCVSGVHGSQREASDPVELELQVVVSYGVGAGK